MGSNNGGTGKKPDAIVEIEDSKMKTVTTASDYAEYLNKGGRIVFGGHAFRVFSPISGPAFNASGNFRGMVISRSWKTAFEFTKKVESTLGNEEKTVMGVKGLGNVFMLIGIAGNIAERSSKFSAIYNSRDTAAMKGMKFAALAGTISQRTLLGIVETPAHLFLQAALGWCEIGALATGRSTQQCVSYFADRDASVKTFFEAYNSESEAAWLSDSVDRIVRVFID